MTVDRYTNISGAKYGIKHQIHTGETITATDANIGHKSEGIITLIQNDTTTKSHAQIIMGGDYLWPCHPHQHTEALQLALHATVHHLKEYLVSECVFILCLLVVSETESTFIMFHDVLMHDLQFHHADRKRCVRKSSTLKSQEYTVQIYCPVRDKHKGSQEHCLILPQKPNPGDEFACGPKQFLCVCIMKISHGGNLCHSFGVGLIPFHFLPVISHDS